MTDLEAIRKRDAEGARPFAHYDRRDLLEEVDRLNKELDTEKKIRVSFQQACSDIAKSGIAERDALRNAVILLQEDNERVRKERKVDAQIDALTEAADLIEAELICCDAGPDTIENHGGGICYWSNQCRILVLTLADRYRQLDTLPNQS